MLPECHKKEATEFIAITGSQSQVDAKQAKYGRTRRGVDRPEPSRP